MDEVRIFISYAREDEARVKQLYQRLADAGFQPWLDREHINPGMRWEPIIKQALKQSDFVLVCLSATSINKRGFLQREIKQALEQADEKLEHDVYLIPVRLDDCEVPDILTHIQWVDLFEDDGWELLLRAIASELKQRGKAMPGSTPKTTPTPVKPSSPPAKPEAPRAPQIVPVITSLAAHQANFPLEPFTFRTGTLNARAEIVDVRDLQAWQYVEDCAGVPLPMVAIPAGEFWMGSSEEEVQAAFADAKRYDENAKPDWFKRETPRRKVAVPALFIGRFQVTQAQWRAVAKLPKVNQELKPDPSNFKGDDRPVEEVWWEDAAEFCTRLARKSGRAYRLPSEAEWEYACRAGTTTPFAFGETITPEIVNCNGNYPYGDAPKGEYRSKTTPVGSLGVANPFGLFDMHGNVWEWCQDVWHDSYKNAPTDGSAWLSGGDSSYHMLRGGSYSDSARFCRSAYRGNYVARPVSSNVGFRVVVSARIS